MKKIDVNDCGVELCLGERCISEPEFVVEVTVRGVALKLFLCKKHANEFEGEQETVGF